MDPELLEELKRLDALMNAPKPVAEHRWYYDSDGTICQCSVISHPPGDNYIVVPGDIYNDYNNYTIKNNEPKRKPKNLGILKFGLFKSSTGQPVVKNNASLVIEDHEDYTEIEYYDARID